jgi:hypothetical protein
MLFPKKSRRHACYFLWLGQKAHETVIYEVGVVEGNIHAPSGALCSQNAY